MVTAADLSLRNAPVHRSPSFSHAVQKMLATSLETFVNA
jgi:hypothetical protein